MKILKKKRQKVKTKKMTKKLVFYFIYILLITQSIQSIGFGSEHDNSIALIILKNPSFDHTHSIVNTKSHLSKSIKRHKQNKKEFTGIRRYGYFIGRKK